MGRQQVKRYHDICAGHRVVGHEGKCRHLHGHNYRVHFVVEAEDGGLDNLGRVVDFSVVKEKLCMWLEDNWDHKFLHWDKDPLILAFSRGIHNETAQSAFNDAENAQEEMGNFFNGNVPLPFNPTAENLAGYLVEVVGPRQLVNTGLILTEVTIEETAKCHVTYTKAV